MSRKKITNDRTRGLAKRFFWSGVVKLWKLAFVFKQNLFLNYHRIRRQNVLLISTRKPHNG